MHRAKAFFYVCAGLFLLVLSYHLGARTAHGQSANRLVAVADFLQDGCTGAIAVDATGRVFFGCNNAWNHVATLSGTPVEIWARWPELFVAMENGDIYRSPDASTSGLSFSFDSNVFAGGPTPAQRESFGSVKSRYRGERGAAQPTTQDR